MPNLPSNWFTPDTAMISRTLGPLEPDLVSFILQTGYHRFSSPIGIEGLAKYEGPRLDLLAVCAKRPGKRQFRKFIAEARKEFSEIWIWEVWNPWLPAVLERYGFTKEHEIQGFERPQGYVWRAQYLKS